METGIVTGLGAMGVACARRLGSGRRLLLADNDPARLEAARRDLAQEGFAVECVTLDIADPASVAGLRERAAGLGGPLRFLVHTAAVSPSLAPPRRIYEVNLVGTARLLDELRVLLVPGSVGVVIASMGAQFVTLPAEAEAILATAPAGELFEAATRWPDADDGNRAYGVSKRGNQLRVEAQSLSWAAKGARLVSISPGVTSTAQGRHEVQSQPEVARLVEAVPMGRIATPDDIAGVAEWLIGPAASYVTGVDLRVDGGTIAAVRWAAHALSETAGEFHDGP